MRLEGRDIVCVGSADWATELPINQHQLMGRLAARNRVLFVESLGLRRPQLAGRDLGRIWRRLRTGLRGARPADGLHVLSPLVLPFHGHAAVRALNRRLLRLQVGRAARRLGMREPILWAYVPQAEALLDVLRPSLVVYHCVDDVAAQKGVDAESFREVEERFARRADLVLASAPALAERMRELSDRVLYAPNVADTPTFAQALEPGAVDPAVEGLPRPRLVFQGAIVATKLNVGLLADVAQLRPEWSIVLVGPRGADVGLIPYAINDLTRSVFPMKVYEYLAAGLPVLATPLPALDGVEAIDTVASAEDLVAACESELAADSPERRRERSRTAASHSWEARLEEIERALG